MIHDVITGFTTPGSTIHVERYGRTTQRMIMLKDHLIPTTSVGEEAFCRL